MKWRYITQKVGKEHWIMGVVKQSMTADPTRPQDIAEPPDFELFDEKLRPLYALTEEGPVLMPRPDDEADNDRIEQEAQAAKAELAATDWRVIRAMEHWMAAHDGLPAEFLAERTALRVKASD